MMRKIPTSSILGLPKQGAKIRYSCFHPVDAGLMFAGCDNGQLHLYVINASKGSFSNPDQPSLSIDIGIKDQQNIAINHIAMRMDP